MANVERWMKNEANCVAVLMSQDARILHTERSLIKAYNKGVMNAAEETAQVGRSCSRDVRTYGSLSRVTSTHVGEFFARAVRKIRKLRIEEE